MLLLVTQRLEVNKLENLANNFQMRISTMKTKTMAFPGKNHIRCKLMIG
jgi:hypothetical protein